MRQKHRLLTAWLLIGGLWAVTAHADETHVGEGHPKDGLRRLRGEVCQECHGGDGNPISDSVPRLAGQDGRYLTKQLRDFRSGARVHDVMTVMAQGLSEDAIPDIAAYFASNTAHLDEDGASSAAGQALYETGVAARDIPACQSCHGGDAKGAVIGEMIVPRLAGQKRAYLRGQLASFRAEERQNSADGVMIKASHGLRDADIEALAAYLSRKE